MALSVLGAASLSVDGQVPQVAVHDCETNAFTSPAAHPPHDSLHADATSGLPPPWQALHEALQGIATAGLALTSPAVQVPQEALQSPETKLLVSPASQAPHVPLQARATSGFCEPSVQVPQVTGHPLATSGFASSA